MPNCEAKIHYMFFISIIYCHAYIDIRQTALTLFFENQYIFSWKIHLFYILVADWNPLPEDIVCAPSLNAFKNRLDKHWREHVYTAPQ